MEGRQGAREVLASSLLLLQLLQLLQLLLLLLLLLCERCVTHWGRHPE